MRVCASGGLGWERSRRLPSVLSPACTLLLAPGVLCGISEYLLQREVLVQKSAICWPFASYAIHLTPWGQWVTWTRIF
jgi:hypothetical protein